jgi:carboxyl-terminal processing protease
MPSYSNQEDRAMSRWNLGWLLGVTVTALIGLSLTHSAPSRDNNIRRKHENLKLVVDVLDEVQQKYVKDLDGDKMRDLVENMVTLGLERLDPHSSFINQEEYKQFQKQSKGRFGGIGIRIGIDRNTGMILVESPMVGTPAYEAGVMAGDLIVKVNDQATDGMPMKKVIESIQGEPGSKVKLTVLHEGAKTPSDIDIVRAEIAVDSVLGDQRMKNNLKEWDFWIDPDTKIAYVRVSAFTETTTAELTKVVAGLQKAGMAGLVVDLRGNPGGLLRSAVEVSSLFLPEGKIVVSTKGRNNQKDETFLSRSVSPSVDTSKPYPLVILINRFSASASEIVAAALQDHLRAIIIGERSYGKGSVQNIIPMEANTSALKLTTASYWRPSGKNIHRFPESKEDDEWGVRPSDNFEVKLTDEERIDYAKGRRDRDIIRRPGQEVKVDEKKKEYRDKVLERAVEHIKGELTKRAAVPQVEPAPVAERRERQPVASDAAIRVSTPNRRDNQVDRGS